MQRANSKALSKMDVKKNASRSVDGKSVVHFVGEVKQELKRVDWTSKEELKSLTKVVLAGTFLFALFIYGVDLIMQGALSTLHKLVSLMVG